MSRPNALFIDLRRMLVITAWPDQNFALVYIVTTDLETTQDFFKTHYTLLKHIPHITVEITQPDTIHLITRVANVTRLSMPIDWITPVLADHFSIDAIIHWDHRRTLSYYKTKIADALSHGVTHLSLYNLQDFPLWQEMQHWLNEQGLLFYERFHASRPGHESPYQNHLAKFGNVIALPEQGGGWSRVTDEQGITRTKGSRAVRWTILQPNTQRTERLLLGLNNRHGLPLDLFTHNQVSQAVHNHLAIVQNDRLCPTDRGLWQIEKLVDLIL